MRDSGLEQTRDLAAANPPDLPGLRQEQQVLWRNFLGAAATLNRRMDEHLGKAAGLSVSDYAILVILSESPTGQLRPGEISELLQWEPSRTSHQLRRMEARNLVVKQQLEADRRGQSVELTNLGQRLLAQASGSHAAFVHEVMIENFGLEELHTISAYLSQVLERAQQAVVPPAT